ncbi:uncharacterized protein [Leptinotarsa decemlineata]|uniref:uncharacterized protein n=1 Tax=Leptinotarsa decemlineata TaxID=7539 RepID=UPI003D30C69C
MLDIVIRSNTHENFSLKVSCAILPVITSKLPRIPLNKNSLNIPSEFRLADPEFHIPSDVDVLLGADAYYDILLPQIHRLGPKLPTLQLTRLGWIIGGQLPPQRVPKHDSGEVEELPKSKFLSADGELAEQIFIQTHVRHKDGTFQVDFPFKCPTEKIPLGDSFHIAKRRFTNLEKRLQNNQELFSAYKNFIDEYVSLKHATYVPFNPTDKSAEIKYFLPHHCVIKESSETTKLRVVFDGSTKTSTGFSLNDLLHKGYQVQPDLYDIFCRFRQHSYVLTCDIEKMYRQVKMNPSQRHLQNILWRNSPQEELKCIQLSTVTYGVTSSSFLATRVLKELASNCKGFPLAKRALLKQTYVDDVLHGTDSLSELEDSYHQLNSLLNSAGFKLHKWSSNSSQFREKYCEDPDPIQYEIKMEDNPSKVLGLSWNPCSDNLAVSLPKIYCNDTPSKRKALSITAQMFDPVGFLGPFIVLAKIFLQKLWLAKISWDEPLPVELFQEWKGFINSIESLKFLKIPRCLFSSKSIEQIQIHGFADSSERAYGACLYFRTTYSDDTVTSLLVTSKSRVAPLKTVSIPRLELCAMVLLTKLAKKVIQIFVENIVFESVNLWTDSQIALHWIQSHTSRWHTFVANRVSQIQTSLPQAQWRHVRSSKNPADLLSRGVLALDLLNSELWWHGPDFLSEINLELSKFILKPPPSAIPEQKTNKLQVLVTSTQVKDEFWNEIFQRFSSFNKLLHSVAYVSRFLSNSKNKETKLSGPLSIFEINSALVLVLRNLQSQYFSKEMSALKSSKSISDKSILALNPFLNEQGLICVGGRLRHADVPEPQKHPILLPAKNYVVSLLLKREHIWLGHAGAQTVLANVRLQYWPLNGIREVKRVIHECMNCFRFRAVAAQQIMSDLPPDRVTLSRPFEKVGVDYGGPFLIKSSRLRKAPTIKCYMAVFVCMATKAVHLELVSSLSSEAFLLTLKRFISRRGIPAVIHSDNATNYVGARNHLRELREFFAKSQLSESLKVFASETGFEWKFIPPRSPHWGGLWEAAVKGAKQHLHRIIGNSQFTFEKFSTVLAQIEAILNSRPLCPISSDPRDLGVLTPGHFLIGRSLTSYPELDTTHLPENRLTFWQRCSQIQQFFWKRWTVEYLNRLQNRPGCVLMAFPHFDLLKYLRFQRGGNMLETQFPTSFF